MRTPQFQIMQGQECYLYLSCPIDLTDCTKIYLTIVQDGKVFGEFSELNALSEYGEISIDDEESTDLVLHLTQAATLDLNAGECEIQIRVKTSDGADTFLPVWGMVGKAFTGGEL